MSVNKIELTSEEEIIKVGRRQQLTEVFAENVSLAVGLAAFAALSYAGIDHSEAVAEGFNSFGSFLTEVSSRVKLAPVDTMTVRNFFENLCAVELSGAFVAGLSAARHGLRLIPRD